MKNIHVLPTDKPSRLYLFEERLILGDLVTVVFKNSGAVNQNIYITSDEEIKEGDWFITEKNTICKCVKVDEKYAYSIEAGSMIKKNCKKIILTTDPDLIKDGVQAIDDDFLEWFVNNPSCEEVEVEDFPMTEKYNSKGEYVHRSYWVYKIIIPKKEAKQEFPTVNGSYGCTIPIKEPKQETLEEASEYYSHNYFDMHETNNYKALKQGFEAGAKWQQEQIGKSEFLQKLRATISDAEARRLIFEQFKNK